MTCQVAPQDPTAGRSECSSTQGSTPRKDASRGGAPAVLQADDEGNVQAVGSVQEMAAEQPRPQPVREEQEQCTDEQEQVPSCSCSPSTGGHTPAAARRSSAQSARRSSGQSHSGLGIPPGVREGSAVGSAVQLERSIYESWSERKRYMLLCLMSCSTFLVPFSGERGRGHRGRDRGHGAEGRDGAGSRESPAGSRLQGAVSERQEGGFRGQWLQGTGGRGGTGQGKEAEEGESGQTRSSEARWESRVETGGEGKG